MQELRVGHAAATATSTGPISGVLIARSALVELLQLGSANSVTLVTAGAGSGKTELVRSWLRTLPPSRPAAWVSVERGERDAQRFWSTVINELRAAAPVTRIEPLTPMPGFDGEAVLEALLDQLASLPDRMILVIDDLHELASAEALGQLTHFLDHIPSSLHVLLIMRRDLPLGLHRQRLAGQLAEIRSADLLFSLQETHELLSAAGIELPGETVAMLHDRTEGWAAALRLAAISLESAPDREAFVRQFSGSERTVAEYLLAEVLESQPLQVRELLMRASLLTWLNGELGDLLTGGVGAGRYLQDLAESTGFVVAVDPQRTRFRLHHLFSDLLAVQLQSTHPEEIPRLHQLAAGWFAAHGEVVEAIVHAQAAGDRALALGLLLEHYFSLALDGRQETASALLGAFGPDPASADAELAVVAATEELFTGSLQQAAGYLTLAARHAATVDAERRGSFDTAYLVARLSLARRLGDFRSVQEDASAANALADPESIRDVSRHSDLRALVLMNLGIVEVWSGRSEQGARHLADAHRLARDMKRPYVETGCQSHLAQAVVARSFTDARATASQAVALAESHGWGSDPVVAPALVTMGISFLQAGRLEEADEWLTRAARTLRSGLEPAVGFVLHVALGGLHQARGNHDAADASFRDAEQLGLLLVSGAPLTWQLRSSMLRARIERGQVAEVRAAVAAMTDEERAVPECREIMAALSLAEGDADQALAFLTPALNGSTRVRTPVEVRCLILAAVAYDALGETTAAQEAIERALDLAEPDTLILPFLHTPSRPLLERHPHHRTTHASLITDILDVISGRARTLEPSFVPPLSEPLTDAELRVLRYLPTNLSATDIASEIVVSVHTVKTHIQHLYRKLDAHNRTEAVKRARDLNLLARARRPG